MEAENFTPQKPAQNCFVIMGYGVKTGFATGRNLDLDKSYRQLIKPAVEEKGLKCVRADEICNHGMIDLPMYQELFNTDILIADLFTANLNAIYELGVRYALKTRTIIVISEDKFVIPFDAKHIKVEKYTHLGTGLNYDEVMRLRQKLSDILYNILENTEPDALKALQEALKLLHLLDLENTNDPETITLAGTIEKGIYEKTNEEQHLDNAIEYYERVYQLRFDRYIGVNLAFLLNCRAGSVLDTHLEEKIADMVVAKRIRREIIVLCEKDLEAIRKREASNNWKDVQENKAFNTEQKFWALVNKAEAHFGLGDMDQYNDTKAEAEVTPHQPWMMQALDQQTEKLTTLLAKQQELLSALSTVNSLEHH